LSLGLVFLSIRLDLHLFEATGYTYLEDMTSTLPSLP
jgi:hypothetical protein